MLAKITAIDLRKPIVPIALDYHYSGLWVLVHLGSQPLGITYLERPARGHVYDTEELENVLANQFGWLAWEQAAIPAESVADQPPISVVVCTRDRAEALRHCLNALAQLDYPNYEVVVVDNASRGPETAKVVAQRGFRYAREERPGLDWARNRGISEARYDIIAYTDDDVRVDPGWLKGIAAAFSDPQVAAVTGLVLPAELETRAQALFERYGGMNKGFNARLLHRSHIGDAGVIGAHQCGVGANMAYRRSTLEQLGGFDTALDVGTASFGGGDIDMFHRVLAAGLALYYEPAALVWHQHRRDMPGLEKQIYSNGRAFGVYLQKIWRDQTVPRRAVAEYAVRWFGGWLVRRVLQKARKELNLPWSIVWGELWGALHARKAFVETYANDRRVRMACEGESVSG
jgi:glycosyltransferase involved in cell wall biosynthesis